MKIVTLIREKVVFLQRLRAFVFLELLRTTSQTECKWFGCFACVPRCFGASKTTLLLLTHRYPHTPPLSQAAVLLTCSLWGSSPLEPPEDLLLNLTSSAVTLTLFSAVRWQVRHTQLFPDWLGWSADLSPAEVFRWIFSQMKMIMCALRDMY